MTTDRDRTLRRTSWWVLVVSGTAFVVTAAVTVPWTWLPGRHLARVDAGQVFTARQLARGRSYSDSQWDVFWWGLGLSLVLAGILGLTPLGARLVSRLRGPWWARTVLAVALVLLLGSLVAAIPDWRSHQLAVAHGLSRQPGSGWLRDEVVGYLVSVVATSIGVVVLVGLARRMPRRWPIAVAVAGAVLTIAASFVYPIVVEPLFNHFRPMAAGPLRSGILELARKEGVHVDEVLVADASRRTTTLNAYVSGFGSTRRVVVYDNLVEDLPRSQTLVVVAHELGHAKHDDVLVGTLLGALGVGVGTGLLGLLLASEWLQRRSGVRQAGEPRVVPLLLGLMTAGTLLASPVQNTISRAVEARADLTSLEVTGASSTFVEMQRQLSLRSLSNPDPPAWRQFWFGSHPTTVQRIGMARAVAEQERPPGKP